MAVRYCDFCCCWVRTLSLIPCILHGQTVYLAVFDAVDLTFIRDEAIMGTGAYAENFRTNAYERFEPLAIAPYPDASTLLLSFVVLDEASGFQSRLKMIQCPLSPTASCVTPAPPSTALCVPAQHSPALDGDYQGFQKYLDVYMYPAPDNTLEVSIGGFLGACPFVNCTNVIEGVIVDCQRNEAMEFKYIEGRRAFANLHRTSPSTSLAAEVQVRFIAPGPLHVGHSQCAVQQSINVNEGLMRDPIFTQCS